MNLPKPSGVCVILPQIFNFAFEMICRKCRNRRTWDWLTVEPVVASFLNWQTLQKAREVHIHAQSTLALYLPCLLSKTKPKLVIILHRHRSSAVGSNNPIDHPQDTKGETKLYFRTHRFNVIFIDNTL